MKQNGTRQPGPQQQPIFQTITVFTEEGVFQHHYAQHNVQFNQGGGGVLVVSETRDNKETIVYPLERIQRMVLRPTSLSVVG